LKVENESMTNEIRLPNILGKLTIGDDYLVRYLRRKYTSNAFHEPTAIYARRNTNEKC
jgi:hypothetical protein